MKFNFEKVGKKIGGGGEKDVFEDPGNPERVVAKFHGREYAPEPELEFKGRYYLTKLLHMLLPKNIPDVHFAAKSGDEAGSVLEKKELDARHKELQRLHDERKKPENQNSERLGELIADYDHIKDVMYRALPEDSRYQAFEKQMDELGVYWDGDPINFAYDPDGNLIYVDNSFIPVVFDVEQSKKQEKRVFVPSFSEERLRAAIESRLQGGEKEKALEYLKRLAELTEKALAERNK